jgi:hypothetical protein
MIEFQPIQPALLTPREAVQYLRLDADGSENEAALTKRLNRLVDAGLIKPALIANKRLYAVGELDRFINDRTEAYSRLHKTQEA